MSPAGSLSNSSECLTALDDSDSTGSMSSPVHDAIIKAAINKSSPLQLTIQAPHREPIMSLKDYLHALDRHKSIDNCFLSPPSDDRLYLLEFDEIKKITNHLFDIAKQKPEPHTNGTAVDIHEHQSSDNRVHDMNIQNRNAMQTAAVDSATKSNTFKESDGVDVKNVKTCDEGLLDVNNNKINDTNGNSSRSHPFAEIFRKFSSLADSGSHVTEVANAPWPVTTRRTKFRVNQMSSRDVPIVRTERPAKLQKQNAIDACDTKLFDERINHKSMFSPSTPPSPLSKNCIVNLLESFERDRDELLQSHFRHKTFVDRIPSGGSISFDCGQLDVEQRSINTIRSLFQLHASTGRNVKQIQARIDAKNKWVQSEAQRVK